VDWSSLGALPVGLVFFAGTAWGVLRRRRGHVAARAEYPAVANELGLTYRPSRYATGVGSLVGTIDRFKVVVDPDEQRRIAVSFLQEPGIVVHHKMDARRPPPGYSTFRLKNQRVATFFPTCWATPAGVAVLGDGSCLEPIVRMLGDLRAVKDVNLTASGLIVSFDFGNPPFIPAEVVRSAVPVMIRLAQTLSHS
jgi:hypothetical protein